MFHYIGCYVSLHRDVMFHYSYNKDYKKDYRKELKERVHF